MMLIRAFGPLELIGDDGPVTLTRPQLRHVLSLLVAADGEWVTLDALEVDLWHDSPPRSPRSSLQLIVNRLRETLGDVDHRIVRHGTNGYRLDLQTCTTDLRQWLDDYREAGELAGAGHKSEALVKLASARGLWRGEAFESVGSSELLSRERFRLAQARLDTELFEAKTLLEENLAGEAITVLESAHARAETREDIAILLMDSLSRLNRRTDAIALAATIRERLREDFGVSPSASFQEAEAALLRTQRDRSTRATPGPAVRWRPKLLRAVGDRLSSALESGGNKCFVVTGPERSGLTTFLTDIGDELAVAGVDVITVRRSIGRAHTLRYLIDETELAGAANQRAEHTLLIDRLGTGSARAGRVIVIDDADRLDDWSLDLLKALGTSAVDAVLLLGLRSADPDDPTAELTADAVSVELGPITVDQVAAMLRVVDRSLTPSVQRRLASEVIRWSGGDALATQQAVDVLSVDRDAELPISSDRRVEVQRALARLDGRWLEAARAAAVLGPELDPLLIGEVVGQPVEETVGVVTALAGSGLVRNAEHQGRWIFVDEMTRAAIREGVADADVLSIHERAGRWLSDHGDRTPLAAWHLLSALPLGSKAAAAKAATSGARELFQTGQYFESAQLFEQAHELADSGHEASWLRYEQALALEWSGRADSADSLFTEIVEGVAGQGDPDLLAAAALAGAGHSGSIGGQERRRRRLQLAQPRLPTDHVDRDAVTVELAYERWAARQPVPSDLIDTIRRIAADGDSTAALLAGRLDMAWREISDGVSMTAAEALADRAIEAAGTFHPQRSADAAKCLVVACSVAQSRGRLTTAEEWLDEIELIGHKTGLPQARWQPLAFRSILQEARGLPESADATASRALRIGRALEVIDAEPTFLLHHLGRAFLSGTLAPLAGDLEAAAERLRFAVWFALRGLAALDAGNELAAIDGLNRALRIEPDAMDYFRVPALALTGLLAARLGRSSEASTIIEALNPFEDRLLFFGYGGPFLGPIDWYRSLPHRGLGNTKDADRLAGAADDLADRSGAQVWLQSPLRSINL